MYSTPKYPRKTSELTTPVRSSATCATTLCTMDPSSSLYSKDEKEDKKNKIPSQYPGTASQKPPPSIPEQLPNTPQSNQQHRNQPHQPPISVLPPPFGPSQESISKWFDHFDHNRSGTLELEEIIRGLQQTPASDGCGSKPTDPKVIRNSVGSVFHLFYRDGSGVINRFKFCALGGLGQRLAAKLEYSSRRCEQRGVRGGSGGQTGSSNAITAEMPDERKRNKCFRNFVRALMKYLDNRDKPMYAKAKEVILWSTDQHKQGNPAFANFSSMQLYLRELVGELYWTKAEQNLCQFLKNEYENKEGMNLHDALLKAKEEASIAASPIPPNWLERLPQMVQGVMGNDPVTQTNCTKQFRQLLGIKKNPPIQQVVDSGVVPRFVEFLSRDDNPTLQFESAYVLTNVTWAMNDHTGTRVVIEAGAVPVLVRLLSCSPNDGVREQVVWVLGNIAGSSPACRDVVLEAGAMEPLLVQLRTNSKITMLRNATWVLGNLCRGDPPPLFARMKIVLGTVSNLIYNGDEEVLKNACWALFYLTRGEKERYDTGVCGKLVELLLHPSVSVQMPVLRAVGNIVSMDDLHMQFVIHHGALPRLLALLSSTNKGIQRKACWTISNITAGSKDQIQAVIDNNIIPPLVQLLTHAELDIRKEAARAISNATSRGNAAQIQYLVQQGCISPLCGFLNVTDPEIVNIILEGLENILKVGEEDANKTGMHNVMATYITDANDLRKIEELQCHASSVIYERCVRILETFFFAESEEEMASPITRKN